MQSIHQPCACGELVGAHQGGLPGSDSRRKGRCLVGSKEQLPPGWGGLCALSADHSASGLWKPQLPQAAVSTDFLRQASTVDAGKGWRELEVSQTAQEG